MLLVGNAGERRTGVGTMIWRGFLQACLACPNITEISTLFDPDFESNRKAMEAFAIKLGFVCKDFILDSNPRMVLKIR